MPARFYWLKELQACFDFASGKKHRKQSVWMAWV